MKKTLTPILFAVAMLSAAVPAYAITATDFLEKMTPEQANAYVFGAAEMAAHLFGRMGDAKRGNCIFDWVEASGSAAEVHSAMERNRNAEPAAVLEALMIQRCGEYK